MQVNWNAVIKEAQVRPQPGAQAGTERILAYLADKPMSRAQTAYILATAAHETGWWMLPIREGAVRYGAQYSDAQAIRAVTSIYNKGIIKTNYALPAGPYGKSYYGRGLIQITWLDNYQSFERLTGKKLVKNPDLALEWDTALDIMYLGMRDGLFRKGNSLSLVTGASLAVFDKARDIVNGDRKANGNKIARIAQAFYNNLKEV